MSAFTAARSRNGRRCRTIENSRSSYRCRYVQLEIEKSVVSPVGESDVALLHHGHWPLLCTRNGPDVRLIVMTDVVDDLDAITDFKAYHWLLNGPALRPRNRFHSASLDR